MINEQQNKTVFFRDLGLMDFQAAWTLQEKLLKATVSEKLANRKREDSEKKMTDNHLLFCAHPPIFTLGKSGKEEHLLLNEAGLAERGIQYLPINRGGDITFHGPGQLVGYPVLDLANFQTDLHVFLRNLEEVIIRTIAEFGLKGWRSSGETGVWVHSQKDTLPKKICALGIRCSRWVSMHGWALNVNTDMNYFDFIVPCGIRDKGVTSIAEETGQHIDEQRVKELAKRHFTAIFGVELV